MLGFSLLIVPPTQAQIEETFLALLRLSGFPTTGWQTTSVPKRLLKASSQLTADVWLVLAKVAMGGYLRTAKLAGRDWLTLLAREAFDERRDPAVATRGLALLEDAGGGPHTITDGQLAFADAATERLIFRNRTGGSIPLNGSLADLEWKAEAGGAAYNLPNDTPLTLLTPLAGVTISIPDPGSGSWITTAGQDEQSDDSLIEDCQTKWATLAIGKPSDALVKLAKDITASAITRVLVDAANPLGPGTTRVVLANATGGASPSEVATVNAHLQPRKALGSGTLSVVAATTNAITVTTTVYVRASFLASAQAAAAANLAALAAELDIGAEVPVSEIVGALTSATGVTKVATPLTSPAADVVQSSMQVATFTLDLAWVSV